MRLSNRACEITSIDQCFAQKVCCLTPHNTSGTHRQTSGGVGRAIGGAYVIFIASAAHGFFKSVNLIDHVSLEDRLRIHRYWGFVVGGEYELALEVITSGKVRGLFVSSLVI